MENIEHYRVRENCIRKYRPINLILLNKIFLHAVYIDSIPSKHKSNYENTA